MSTSWKQGPGRAESSEERETRAVLLEASRRVFVPIPKVFVQHPRRPGVADRHGPLAEFVRAGDRRGLLALLMVHGAISSGAGPGGFSKALPLMVWARAFGTTVDAEPVSARSAATRILARLERRRLIERRRVGQERRVQVRLLAADGSGRAYTRPRGTSPGQRFLRLSHRFWTEGWDQELSLPGIAMLLVALHERPGFALATAHMPAWYGFSADTAERGFAELRDHGLLRVERRSRRDPLTTEFVTWFNQYTLVAPFDPATVQTDQDRKIHGNDR
ncbi:hypothetical protein [Acidipropionibacterium virtanenii]|uniref:hypothetical protein n=1 Tax=Acidipropionibacterium virtanenii TaxID=2057246 RepID=UPI0011BE5C6D|nr:hypothetical protein [Acidipropionibacterium virtanenii]